MSKIAGAVMIAVVVASVVWGIGATTASAGGGVLTLDYPNGDYHNFSCQVGSKGSTQSEDGQWPDKAANGCTTVVRLFEDPGEQGNQLCLGRGAVTGILHTTWRSYRVESSLFC